MVSMVTVEMEILNGSNTVVPCLGLRHDDSVWGAKPKTALHHFCPFITLLFYKGLHNMKLYRAEFLLKVDFDVSDTELTREGIFDLFFQALNLEQFIFNGIKVKPKSFRGEGHINERSEDLSDLDQEEMVEV